jgi:arginyl-tRNA synthetase
VGDSEVVAEKIAIGALHYYLLNVSPSKDMLFDPKESLSFNGNTGPYLQYMGARISSLLRKAAERNTPETACSIDEARFELLTADAEWELIKTLGAYNNTVAAAAADMDPSVLAAYLYDLAKGFSRFYHDCPVLSAEEPALAVARLALCRAVLLVLKDALDLICIPFLDAM